MSETVETMKIKDPAKGGTYIIINASDFDAEKHQEYVEPKQTEVPADKADGKK